MNLYGFRNVASSDLMSRLISGTDVSKFALLDALPFLRTAYYIAFFPRQSVCALVRSPETLKKFSYLMLGGGGLLRRCVPRRAAESGFKP